MNISVDFLNGPLTIEQFRRAVSDIEKLIAMPPRPPSDAVLKLLTEKVVKRRIIQPFGRMNSDGGFNYTVSEYSVGKMPDDLFHEEREIITSSRDYTQDDLIRL